MSKFGVIDLGSNSVRLVVYEVKAPKGGRFSKKDFSTLLDMKKMAGLSAYVVDGVFSKEGIQKASYILSRHLVRAANAGCSDVEIFATAVLRNCTNSKEAVAAIEKAVGRKIRLLSGKQEAQLDLLGAACEYDIGDGTLIDIGGGSTELVDIRGGQGKRALSLDQGSVSSYAQYVKMVLPTKRETEKIRKALRKRLEATEGLSDFRHDTLYGVGGSVRAVAKMLGAIEGAVKVPRRVERSDVARLLAMLTEDRSRFAHKAAQAVPDRLHTIGCGLAMVDLLLETFDAKRIEICRYGVREGFLIHTMTKRNAAEGKRS